MNRKERRRLELAQETNRKFHETLCDLLEIRPSDRKKVSRRYVLYRFRRGARKRGILPVFQKVVESEVRAIDTALCSRKSNLPSIPRVMKLDLGKYSFTIAILKGVAISNKDKKRRKRKLAA